MADSTTLRYGGSEVTFKKSPTQVAVRPASRVSRRFAFALDALVGSLPAERHGRIGRYEILEIQASEAVVANERANLGRSGAVRETVSVYHTSDDGVPFVPDGTIRLTLASDATERDLDNLLAKYDIALTRVTADRAHILEVGTGDGDAVDVAAWLQQEASVAIAEPNLVTPRRLLNRLPDDRLLSRQWHLQNLGEIDGSSAGLKADADARVVAAWQRLGHMGSPEAVIGIIDDGFDLTHPDLRDKAIHPWDFIRGNEDVRPEPDLHAPDAGDWHGTACAGVALGMAGGGAIVGAAPNAKLIPVRMGENLSPGDVARWFDYVTEMGAWVVSCSWNAQAAVYHLPDEIHQAIHRCATQGRNGKGCVVVFAAGNTGRDVNDPPRSHNGFATHPDVIAVTSTSSLDRKVAAADIGDEIAVCAPSAGLGGRAITTADATGTYLDADGVERSMGYATGAYTEHFRGTSSSCPLVAGVCSLILSANPDLSAETVRAIVRSSARQIGPDSEYPNGHSKRFGHGCIDADKAVAEALDFRRNPLALAKSQVSDATASST